MLRAHRAVQRRIAQWVWDCPDDALFVRRFQLANRQWSIPMVVRLNPAGHGFDVFSDGQTITVARRSRLHYYKKGAKAREAKLIREYMLERVPFEAGDRVVDVGANIGEVSRILALRHRVIPIAIEPEEREFRALEANLLHTGGVARNDLAWSHTDTIRFHDVNDSGDSSVFAPTEASPGRDCRARPLDDILSGTPAEDGPIRLLKLEAEGAEPEVLVGAGHALARVEYVTADVGPERGPTSETTLIPVYEALRDAGFHAIAVQHGRLVMLFKRG